MIPHLQQPTEWIITEIELRALMGYLHDTHKYRGHEIGCRVRSRPHSPAQSEQEIRPEVMKFALHMETVLRRNDHKKSWKHCTYEYLLDGIKRETVELEECFWKADDRSELNMCDDYMPSRRFTDDAILSECADVANFAMMIFDKLRSKQGEQK
jgi:hypothetical protein